MAVKVEYVYLIRPKILPVLDFMYSLIKRLYIFRNLICSNIATILFSRSFAAFPTHHFIFERLVFGLQRENLLIRRMRSTSPAQLNQCRTSSRTASPWTINSSGALPSWR